MAQWGVSDSGILRKNPRLENHEELLVFGYSCKLFRDDEKALYIDQGKHLIPWMGDETLKIDRYDCRGALGDLKKYEASREGFDAMRWLGLSEKDRQLEELCDRERYYSLEINEEEEELYKEEEHKRQNTNTFQYSYDVSANPEKKEEGPIGPELNDEEEEYVPPPILDVPVDIDIPKTVKENARIEKTAKFVCTQGPQMEILIKAKQGNNPQFSFLNQGDRLYKFYRHVLAAFKNGRYQGYEPILENKTGDQQDVNDADFGGHYLHPSLLSATQQLDESPSVHIPQVPYKPSANCAYSQLVNRIQGTQNDQAQDAGAKPAVVPVNFSQMTYEQQQYYQYYYAQQYYEYYKQMALFQQGNGGNPGQFVPPPDFQNLDPTVQNYIQQIAYSQYLHHQQQQHADNSYAQIVSNVNKDTQNPYITNVPQLPQVQPQKDEMECLKNSPETAVKIDIVKKPAAKAEVIIKKPLASLAAYGSGSDSESDDSTEEEEEDKKEVYKVPSGDTQLIIDKMALYVSKNGEQFETLVKARGDPRFYFLNDDHEYNKYYKEKIRELRGGTVTKKEEVLEKREVKEAKSPKKEKKVIAPVSFSIKKAKEEQPKEIKSALPVEESDDEEPETFTPPTTAAPVTTTPTTIVTTSCVEDNSKSPEVVSEIITIKDDKDLETKEDELEVKKNGILDGDDPILEMIELTAEEVVEDKKEARRAEDKIKDKLIAAAREKLSHAARDRTLQQERKKRAAAFLKLKSAETNNGNDTTVLDVTSPSKSSSRRSSVEIIEIPSSPVKKSREKSRSRERERRKEREKRREERHRKGKDRDRSREKKRSRTPRRDSGEEETENKRRNEEDKKEKKKKSHKRKHSKSRHESRIKKKSKKRHRRSESESSSSNGL